MALAIFDLDNTLLAGDSDYLWGQYLGEIGVVDRIFGGSLLYVAERLNDHIAVINTESLETMGSIDLEGPKRRTVARHGRQVLNNAKGTFQNQYACYTCHPDVHEDGLVYNMAGTT